MDGTKSTATVLMTFLIAAVMGALAWFFFFNPTINEIGEIEDEASAQEDLNETLEIQVAALAADFERLPEIRQEIDAVAGDVPPIEDQPGFIRTLVTLVEDYDDVVLERLDIGVPEVVQNSVTLAEAAAVFDEGSYIESLEFEGLIGTSFTLQVLGPRDDVLGMLEDIQTGEHRYFLVEDFTATPLDPAEASGARPEIGEGWVDATVPGWFFTVIQPGIDPTLKPGPDGEIPTRISLAAEDESGEGENEESASPEPTPTPTP